MAGLSALSADSEVVDGRQIPANSGGSVPQEYFVGRTSTGDFYRPHLIDALEDDDERIATSARKALQKIKTYLARESQVGAEFMK